MRRIAVDWAGPYLAAMIEGEGHVARSGDDHPRVGITNTNVFILNKTYEALESIGVVRLSARMDQRDKTVTIAIYGRDNFQKLWDACGEWLASHKRDRLRGLAEYEPKSSGKRCADDCTCGRHVRRFKVGSRRHRRGHYGGAK